jgi:hypothetical protein
METATPRARAAVHDLRLRPRQQILQQTGPYTIDAEVELDTVMPSLNGDHDLLYASVR